MVLKQNQGVIGTEQGGHRVLGRTDCEQNYPVKPVTSTETRLGEKRGNEFTVLMLKSGRRRNVSTPGNGSSITQNTHL